MINAEALRQGDAEIIENLLSEQILDAAIEVRRTLGGPGLLESLYEDALFHELRLRFQDTSGAEQRRDFC